MQGRASRRRTTGRLLGAVLYISTSTDFSPSRARRLSSKASLSITFHASPASSSPRAWLPANGFYEWRGAVRKRPYWLTHETSPLYFAAIWEAYPVEGHTYLSVAVVTQAAADQRRPLLLDEAGQEAWLAADTSPAELQALLAKPPLAMRERVLANLVNDPKLDAPECLTPA